MPATAQSEEKDAVTVRRYAEIKGIALMTGYQHIWQRKVEAKQYLGRWLIFLPKDEMKEPNGKE